MNTFNFSYEQMKAGLTEKAKSSDFAASLLSQLNTRGTLSDRQREWAYKLAAETLGETIIPGSGLPAGSKVNSARPSFVEDLGADFKELINKFATAKTNGLKRPALTFAPNGFSKFKIYPAQETSANAGWLYVKGDGTYFGKINNKGEFFKGRDCTPDVSKFLKELAKNPVEFCAAQGRETGWCCFCGRQLTDERSLKNSWGPICAAKWGLNWG